MIKILFVIIAASFATQAFADEVNSMKVSTKHFHLLNWKCEPGGETDRLENSPQSPPLEVDDPGTPGCNRWEINVVASEDATKDQKTIELPLLDLNYGIGDNLQLKYEVPFEDSTTNGKTNSAVSDSKAGVKFQFYENEETETQLAVYPQVAFSTPGSDAKKKGLSGTGTITTIPLLFATKIGETSKGSINLSANIGYNLSTKEDEKDFISSSVGIGIPLSTKLALMGDLATEQATQKNTTGIRDQLVKFDVGVLAMVSSRVLVFGSLGQSIYSSDDQKHTYGLTGLRYLTR